MAQPYSVLKRYCFIIIYVGKFVKPFGTAGEGGSAWESGIYKRFTGDIKFSMGGKGRLQTGEGERRTAFCRKRS